MIRGLYSTATGMINQSKRIDIIGNNVSNINTDGYKSDELSLKTFDEVLATRSVDNAAVGNLVGGVALGAVTADLTQGPLDQTMRSGDLAVAGDGFFAVEGQAGGVKYTRGGSFTVDNGGYLALLSGERLLNAAGQPVYVGSDDFAVAADGTVAAAGVTDKISLYTSPEQGGITKRTDGFYDMAQPTAATGKIMQGYLEGSNVDAVKEMTSLMEATRSFQSCQQAYQVNNETLDRLISQIGSLKS